MFTVLTLFAVTFSCGIYLVTADYLALPTFRAARVALNIMRQDKGRQKSLDMLILSLSSRLSRFIRMDAYRKRKLSATLRSAGIQMSPETYMAQAWVKSGLVLLAIVPALLIFPILSFVILFLAIMVYFRESGSADQKMKRRRETIENELTRFVLTLEQELKGSRDVLRILQTYKKNAGAVLRHELDITTADMLSGSHEAALTRFEARVGSAMLSDVVRGLLSVVRGDDGSVYFQMLAHDFKLLELQKLKLIAMKRPAKVRKYSLFMLGCFVLMYLAVMAVEFITAFTTLF